MSQVKFFPKQSTIMKILLDKTTIIRELLIGGGAGGAKSSIIATWLTYNCVTYPGTRWLLGRSELSALKITTYNTLLDVCKDFFGLTYGKDFKLTNNNVVKFRNGSEIVLMDMKYYPNKDPDFDKLGSTEFTGGALDEVAQITYKGYQVASTRVGRYKNDLYGLPGILLMSCNPTKGRVYKEFYKKQKEGTIEPHRKFIQVLASNNPYIPKEYLIKLSNMPEGPMKERLYKGNWEYDDTPGIMFDWDKCYDMFRTKGIAGERYITVDVARQGSDRTTCIYWEGLQGYVMFVEDKSDIKKLAERIKNLAFEKRVKVSTNVIADEDGVGGGLVDILGCRGFLNNGAVVEDEDGVKPNYQNLKTQCYFLLAQYVQDSFVGMTCDPVLEEGIVEELHAIREMDMDKDQKRRVISKKELKEELGRSPDFADNIMMRMLPEVAKIPDYSWALRKDEDDQE